MMVKGWYLGLLFDGVGFGFGLCCEWKGLIGMGGASWVDGGFGGTR